MQRDEALYDLSTDPLPEAPTYYIIRKPDGTSVCLPIVAREDPDDIRTISDSWGPWETYHTFVGEVRKREHLTDPLIHWLHLEYRQNPFYRMGGPRHGGGENYPHAQAMVLQSQQHYLTMNDGPAVENFEVDDEN